MKKLYKAGLAVLAIALLTSSALAYSPSWDTVPDVIVGGGDLIFTNAFNWQDYVSDQDTTPISTLQVVFAEGAWQSLADRSLEETDGTATQEVGISISGGTNPQDEVNYSGVGGVEVSPPPLFDASTLLDNWLTFTASASADRAVVLIASDGATTPVASNAFRVRETSALPDLLTYPTTVTNLDSWDTDADWDPGTEWLFINLNSPTSAGTGSGSIAITAGVDAGAAGASGDNDFAFWQLIPTQTLVPITAGQIVRARWTVNGGTTPVTQWNSVQLRMFQENDAEFQWTALSATKYIPDPGNSRTYESFMQPSPEFDGTGLIPGFFVIDNDIAQGGVYAVEQLVVDGITGLDSLFGQEFVIDSGEAIDFTVDSVDFFDLYGGSNISSSGSADSFTYNVTTPNALDFSTAQFNTGFNMAANTLYRIVSTFSSTQTQVDQPKYSVQAFSTSNEVTVVTQYQGTGGFSTHMPDSGGKTYNCLLPSTGIDGLELRISFNVYNDSTRSGPMTWERVVVQSVPLSSIP